MCSGRNYLTVTIVITPSEAAWVSLLPWSILLHSSLDHIPVYSQQVVDEHPKPEKVCLTSQQRAP